MIFACLTVFLVSAQILLAAPPLTPLTQAKNPVLQITHIDTTRFPQVDVYVHGENLGAALDGIPLILKEDDREQTVTANSFAPVGVQLALVAAVSGSGPGSDPYPGMGEAARRLVNLGLLSPATDQLAVWGATDSINLGELFPWGTHHGQAAETLARYRLPNNGQKLRFLICWIWRWIGLISPISRRT